jgi:hypothetical protein
MLLANEPGMLHAKNPVHHLLGEGGTTMEVVQAVIDHHVREADLDATQARALGALTESLPGGIQILFGGAGTGKSKIAREIVKVSLSLRTSAIAEGRQKSKTRILITCPSNAYTDEVALKILEEAAEVCAGNMPCVIRVHAEETEHKVSKLVADYNRYSDAPKLHMLQEDPDLDAVVTQLDGARELLDRYREHTAQTHAGINDKRLNLMEVSLGTRVLQVTGILRGENGKPYHFAPEGHEETFNEFAIYLNNWSNNGEFGRMDKTAFKDEYRAAVATTLRDVCDIVITTTSQALTATLHENFRPDWVISEELGRASEADFVALTALYDPHYTVLVGDTFQLPPVTKMTPQTEYFQRQAMMSPLTRMIATGYRQYETRTQHRSHDSITQLLKRLAYPDATTSPEVAGRDSCKKVKSVFRQIFGQPQLQCLVLWCDVDSQHAVDSRFSRFNTTNIKVAMYWLARLVQCGIDPGDVLIVVPYTAQVTKYGEMMRKCNQWIQTVEGFPDGVNMGQVRIVSIDDVQGTEGSVVILDTTVSDKPGFMAVSNRMIVALSRAKDGILIIGNSDSLEKGERTESPVKYLAIGKTWAYCKARGTFFKNDEGHIINGLDEIMEARQKIRQGFTEPLRIDCGVTRVNPAVVGFTARAAVENQTEQSNSGSGANNTTTGNKTSADDSWGSTPASGNNGSGANNTTTGNDTSADDSWGSTPASGNNGSVSNTGDDGLVSNIVSGNDNSASGNDDWNSTSANDD